MAVEDLVFRIRADAAALRGVSGEVGKVKASIGDLRKEAGLLDSADPELVVTAETTGAAAELQALDGELRSLEDEEVRVTGDGQDARAEVAAVGLALLGLEDEEVGITGDGSDAIAETGTVAQALAGLADEDVAIRGDGSDAVAEVGSVAQAVAGLRDAEIAIRGDGSDAVAETGTVAQALAGLRDEEVRVTADTSDARADVEQLKQQLAGLGDETANTGAGLGGAGLAAREFGMELRGAAGMATVLKGGIAGLAGGAAATGLYALAGATSDLSESTNVVALNFGDATAEMLRFTADAPQRIGTSTRAANEMSATLAGLLLNLGFTGDEVTSLSQRLLVLGADMGSAFNREPVEAIEAIVAGLIGETEQLKRFNVILNQAKIQQEAMNLGLWDGAGALSDNAKAQATLSLIMQGTERVAGDFANTSEGLANSTRTLSGEWENFRAVLGESIEGPAAGLTAFLTDALGTGADLITNAGLAADHYRGRLGDLLGILGELPDRYERWRLGTTHVGQGLRETADLAGENANVNRDAAAAILELDRNDRLTTEGLRDLATASREGAGAAAWLDDESRTLANGVEHAGDAARRSEGAVAGLRRELDLLIGVNIGAREADIRRVEALERLGEVVHENADATGKHNLVLDINTEAGRANQSAILDIASATVDHVVELRKQGALESEVTEALRTGRQALIDKMVQLGWTDEKARQYVDGLGLTEASLKKVAGESTEAKRKTDDLAGAIEGGTGAARRSKRATEELEDSVRSSGTGARWAADRFVGLRDDVHRVPNSKVIPITMPGLHGAHVSLDAFKQKLDALKGGQVHFSLKLTQEHIGRPMNDGPGGPIPGRSGTALARVRSILPAYPGLRVTSTYRTPARNRAVGGSPTSYHLDFRNPAVDIGGPAWQLDRFVAALRRAGGWREGPIWRAPGHYDHAHVAHEGGLVAPWWARAPGLRDDERPVIAQLGETIVPRGGMERIVRELAAEFVRELTAPPVRAAFRAVGAELAKSVVAGIHAARPAPPAPRPVPRPPPPPPAPRRPIHEDQPGWDWRTMGNRMRGIQDRRGYWYHEHADGHIRNTHPRSPGAPMPPRFHEGGIVSPHWARAAGLRPDERQVVVQVGELIVDKATTAELLRKLPRAHAGAMVGRSSFRGLSAGDRAAIVPRPQPSAGPTLYAPVVIHVGQDVGAGTILELRRAMADRDREMRAALAAK